MGVRIEGKITAERLRVAAVVGVPVDLSLTPDGARQLASQFDELERRRLDRPRLSSALQAAHASYEIARREYERMTLRAAWHAFATLSAIEVLRIVLWVLR